jgi:hypothetical protein
MSKESDTMQACVQPAVDGGESPGDESCACERRGRSITHAMGRMVNAAAANPTRARTTVSGPTSASAILAKQNEPLPSTVSAASSAHSLRSITT